MGNRKNSLHPAACLATLALLLLSSCSTVSVRTRPGMVTKEGLESADILQKIEVDHGSHVHTVGLQAQGALRAARKLERRGKVNEAAACYLSSAIESSEALSSTRIAPGEREREVLMELHNLSLARFAELW